MIVNLAAGLFASQDYPHEAFVPTDALIDPTPDPAGIAHVAVGSEP
ncbi:hypothetical protein [Hartmannibacter diazotrophicus]|nr:hypothetical protein [Hartmannibacter diazotrophicus]